MNFFTQSQARVVAHNPPFGLQVVFKSMGQQPSFPVTLARDYCDAVRVRQKPLPQIGTWGVVIFPYGDIRNGIWLTSYYPSFADALTTTQASGAAPTDAYIDYEASFSGDWWIQDGLGNRAHQFADSSYLIASAASGLPTLYRHTIDDQNQRKTVEFPFTDRVSGDPAGPFYYKFKHATGTSFSIDPSGNMAVSGVGTLSFLFGGSTITIDTSGNVKVALTNSDTFSISQSGMPATDALVLVSKFLPLFNGHTHSGGGSGPVSTPLTSGQISSAVIPVSD